LSQQAGGPEQPSQGVLAAPRGRGSRGPTILLMILAFSAGGYFGYQLNGSEISGEREAAPQREASPSSASGASEVTSVAHGRNCNSAPAIIAKLKGHADGHWPRHLDPLFEGLAVPAGQCMWVDWNSGDEQLRTTVGWVDLAIAEGWYLDDKLTCPAPGAQGIGPPA
jgi:hypothetical protein